MVILTSEYRPTNVKNNKIIFLVHLVWKLGILLMSNPLEFYSLFNPVIICIQAFSFEVLGTWNHIFGVSVIMWISLPIIYIGMLIQRYPSWYRMTIKFVIYSFHFPKLAICGAPRRCLIHTFSRNCVSRLFCIFAAFFYKFNPLLDSLFPVIIVWWCTNSRLKFNNAAYALFDQIFLKNSRNCALESIV
jgi:hypothetical protein